MLPFGTRNARVYPRHTGYAETGDARCLSACQLQFSQKIQAHRSHSKNHDRVSYPHRFLFQVIFQLAAFLTVEELAQIFFCENSERITHIQRQLEIGQIGNIFPPNPTFGAGM